MTILQFFAGSGRRRKSDENWSELEQKLSTAEARAARVKDAVLNTCPARVHGPFWVHTNKPVACPWCLVDQLRGQIQMLTTRPTPRPDTILPESAPESDVTAETQPVDVRDLRAAMGENDTITLPAITPAAPLDDTQMLVTWGAKLAAKAEADTQQIRLPQIPDRPPVADPVEAALNTPAPPPGAGASEISMAAGLAAVTKVHATVTAN